MVRYFGFAHYLYGVRVPLTGGDNLQYLYSGYPKDWMATYLAKDYIRIDPVVEYCFFGSSNLPLIWGDSLFDSPERKRFWEDSQGHGVTSGMSVPVRGTQGESALFSVANPERSRDATLHQIHTHTAGVVYILGNYVHEAIRRLVYASEQMTLNTPALTVREMDCLKWWVDGKSGREIGRILNLSERTVRFHLDNIKKKYSVHSKTQMVARAIQLKLIPF